MRRKSVRFVSMHRETEHLQDVSLSTRVASCFIDTQTVVRSIDIRWSRMIVSWRIGDVDLTYDVTCKISATSACFLNLYKIVLIYTNLTLTEL